MSLLRSAVSIKSSFRERDKTRNTYTVTQHSMYIIISVFQSNVSLHWSHLTYMYMKVKN